jgi:hypothetical protein
VADVESHDQHRHRPPAETLATEAVHQAGPVKTIATAKRPRKRHYGEIIGDRADPPDYGAATERARQRAGLLTDLPTGRGLSNHKLIVWCKACRRQRGLSGADIVAMGRGDVPLVDLKWRCTNCGSYWPKLGTRTVDRGCGRRSNWSGDDHHPRIMRRRHLDPRAIIRRRLYPSY